MIHALALAIDRWTEAINEAQENCRKARVDILIGHRVEVAKKWLAGTEDRISRLETSVVRATEMHNELNA